MGIQAGRVTGTALTDKQSVVVDNTLDRKFDVDALDRVWVTDITCIRTQEGSAYLAVVIDLYSRRVIGCDGAYRR